MITKELTSSTELNLKCVDTFSAVMSHRAFTSCKPRHGLVCCVPPRWAGIVDRRRGRRVRGAAVWRKTLLSLVGFHLILGFVPDDVNGLTDTRRLPTPPPLPTPLSLRRQATAGLHKPRPFGIISCVGLARRLLSTASPIQGDCRCCALPRPRRLATPTTVMHTCVAKAESCRGGLARRTHTRVQRPWQCHASGRSACRRACGAGKWLWRRAAGMRACLFCLPRRLCGGVKLAG